MLADINLIPHVRPAVTRDELKRGRKDEDGSRKVVPRRRQAEASKRGEEDGASHTLNRYA